MWITRILLPLCACVAAQAQEAWDYRLELFGTAAQNRFYNGDDLWASRGGFGGGFAVRPFTGRLRALGFELQAGTLRRAREIVQSESARTETSFDARYWAVLAAWHFRPRARVQPYLSGGLSLLSADRSFSCEGCVFNVDPETGALIPVPSHSRVDSSKAGIAFGGGFKVAVHKHISIRPEMLLFDTTPGSGHNWGWLRFQIGVGLHF